MTRQPNLIRKFSTVLLACSLWLGAAAVVHAADEPQNVVNYRQAVMKAIGGHTGAIAGVVKGEVSYAAHVEGHAHAIAELAKLIPTIFPEGTGPDKAETRALAKIWEDWAGFEAAAKKLQEEAAKLAEVAKGGDAAAIGAQMGVMGKDGCGGCHKPFRKPK